MKNNRKTLLIYPEIQLPLVYIALSLILIVSLIQILTLIFFLYKYRYGDAAFDVHQLLDVVFNIFYYRASLLLILVIPFLLILAFFARYFLFISNKYAGPIYRIEKTLDEINETGEFKDIQIRSNDFLIKFVEKINTSFKSVLKKN